MYTRSIAPYTLIEPLRLANRKSLRNERQRQLLDIIRAARKDETPQTVSVHMFRDVGEASLLLRDEGFDIMPEPIPEGTAGEILVTIMNLVLKWRAQKGVLNCNGSHYRSVELEGRAHRIPIHPHPIVELYNESEYKVYVTKMTNHFKHELDILYTVNSFAKLCVYGGLREVEVSMPSAHIDHKPDISWIEGMSCGEGAAVHKAYKQVKLDINEMGAKVKAATAITITGFCLPSEPEKVVIDGPYLFWIVDPNLTQPLYAGHIMPDAFEESN